jgi:hypothetical protein
MAQPRWINIRRYAHCDPLDEGAAWDGVALLWYRGEAARLRHVGDEAARTIMRADEAETFARPVREFSTLVAERVVAGGPSGPFKRFEFLWRDRALTRAAFQHAWARDRASTRLAMLAASPEFRALTVNVARPEAELRGFGLDCDLIEESDWTAPIEVPTSATSRSEILWCREVVLFDDDQA